MNGLTLRINKGGGRKSKTSLGFATVDVSKFISETLVKKNNNFYKFMHASSADKQLAVLKIIVDEIATTETSGFDEKETLKFLAAVFFHAEVKHPVKCFLSRHITKNNKLQEPFTDSLAEQIVVSIFDQDTLYRNYVAVVSKLACCIENFPAGSAAVKKEEVRLTEYLDGCLKCCVQTLRTKTSLSPTEKNEIFNLAHLALRLLLYITQKISPNVVVPTSAKFPSIRGSIQDLLFDEDVPMDTKSVCGILYLTMHVLENGSDSWVEILQMNTKDETIRCLLSNEASQLSLYSAIATAVAMDRLQSQIVDGKPALVTLNQRILTIGERSSSESIFMLGVTRTLVQISKGLDKLTDGSLGLTLVGDLLNFVWAHLEHYMDSVRHLTAQILGNIVRYCSKLDREGNPTALTNLFSTLTSLDKGRKSYYVSLTSLVNEIGASEVLRRLPRIIRDTLPSLSAQAVQASATTSLETLLQKHVKESNTDTIYREWIEPVLQHVASHTLDSGALNIIENLMARAVKLDENVINYILPHMKRPTTELKCVLMLLSVARKSGVTGKLASGHQEWKGIISYDVLDMAAVDAVDETRILSLSLVVESPKTTEVFSRRELAFVLHYLKYNANAQSPNFRQLTLSIFKKAISLHFTRGHPDIQKNWKWALTFLLQHSIFTLTASCYIYTVVKYDIKSGDFVAASANISLVTVWPVVSFYYFILIKYQRSFQIMTATMKKDYETASTLSPDEQDVVLQYAKKGELVTKIWIAIPFFSFLASVVKTQIIMLYYTIIDESKYVYIVKFYIPGLPEDFSNSLVGYYLTFLMTTYYFLYCCMMYPGMAPMGPILMLHAGGQLELLRMRTMQLYPKYESVTLQQRMIKLKTIAIQLQEIYDFVDHINSSHKMMFEMTLKGAAVIVPVLFYQLLGSFRQGQVDIEFTFFVMLGGCVFSAFPCYYGDILMSKSKELQLALYTCGWESVWERRVRSSLLLMMTRTTRAVAIRTVFRTISLEALADCARQAFTLFNLINTVWE